MLPFTTEQFLALFGDYNLAVWPAQAAVWPLGLLAAVLAARPAGRSERVVCAILALFWLWMGVAYHILFFASINPLAPLFGAGFVLQGLLFALHALRHDGIGFHFGRDIAGVAGLAFVAYGLVVYHLLAPLFGHAWPRIPVFGVAPCPTTIFTFGILLMARGRVPWSLLAVPFLWTLVGGSAALVLAVPEDYGLIVAGMAGTLLIGRRNLRLVR